MRLRRGTYRRPVAEDSNASDAPPLLRQFAVRGRARGSASSSGHARLPEAPQSSTGRARRVRGEDSTFSLAPAEREAMIHHLAMEMFNESGLTFSERRRRAVRINTEEPGSSRTQIPTLRTAAAVARARSLIAVGRRNASRRNQSSQPESAEAAARRLTGYPTIRYQGGVVPETPDYEIAIPIVLPNFGTSGVEAARERARRERDRRNERRNLMMQEALSPNIEQEMASVFASVRRIPRESVIDLTNDDSSVSPSLASANVILGESSSSSASSSSSSSDSSSQLASPLSAITSEGESINFLGAIGRRSSSNEE